MSEQLLKTSSSSAQKLEQDDSTEKQKISVYLTEEQVQKLEDLVHEYSKRAKRKRSGKQVKRTDIIRYLIDR